MPTFTRKTLRQDLGRLYLRDMVIGNTGLSLGLNATLAVMDSLQANFTYSGQGMFERAFLRVASGDFIVGTFNAPSGAFVSYQLTPNVVASGTDYELSTRLNAPDKDLMLDQTLLTIRLRQEVAFITTQDEQLYSIEGVGSPYYVSDILDAYYFANPTGTLGRDLRRFDDFRIVTTATGREVRIRPSLAGSQQVVLDAILAPTLGSGDAATVNIPNEEWVLRGAAARCYDLLIQSAPGQQVDELAKRRAEHAGAFTRLSSRYAPLIERKIRFNDPRE